MLFTLDNEITIEGFWVKISSKNLSTVSFVGSDAIIKCTSI